VLTSLTGFLFPFERLLPSHIVGIISLVVLAAALVALYVRRLAGSWRWIYVTGAVSALYLNAFVGVVQAFQKLPVLNALAPTQSEPPFVIAQIVVLLLFVVLGIAAVRTFHPRSRAGGLSAA
jgi:ABC-type Na+ efflux pump permease subunit